MNVVILQGRLTDDPKVWYGNEGNSVSVTDIFWTVLSWLTEDLLP